MNIRRAGEDDFGRLLEIWLGSVRASHDFLSEAEIQSFLPLVRDHALPSMELWLIAEDSGAVVGFMGLDENKLEALFIAPKFFRRAAGTRLVEHAQKLKGPLLVDVNEQNPRALKFYEALGFVVEGRSELDGQGKPYPLLHMRQTVEEKTTE